jgi:hypothetical protein
VTVISKIIIIVIPPYFNLSYSVGTIIPTRKWKDFFKETKKAPNTGAII